MDEEGLVEKMLASLPVLRDSLPLDVSRLVGLLRKAFVSQGLSRSSRARILAAIEALSRFEVGLITAEELALCRDLKEVHEPVATVAEVMELASQLGTLARTLSVFKTTLETDTFFRPATPPVSETAQEGNGCPEPASSNKGSPVALFRPATSPVSETAQEGNGCPEPASSNKRSPVAFFRPATPPVSETAQEGNGCPEPASSNKRSPVALFRPATPPVSETAQEGNGCPEPASSNKCSPVALFRPVTPPISETAQEGNGYPEPASSNKGSPLSLFRPATPPISETAQERDGCPEPATPPPSETAWERNGCPEPATPPPSETAQKRNGCPEPATPPPSETAQERNGCPEPTASSEKGSPVATDSSCCGALEVASTDEDITISIHVPEYKYGKLLGTGGTNIKRIEALTGAKLVLLKEYGALEIRGVKKQCLEARILAQQLVNEVDRISGVLCHLPPNFFDQRSIWTASRLEDIATQNSCILEPLMGIYNRGNCVFICGTLQSDIECCHRAIEKWVIEFLQTRSVLIETCNASRTQNQRVQYSRSQLMSLSYGGAELALKFLPGTEELGIIKKANVSRSSAFVNPWSTVKRKSEEKCRSQPQESKWEHDLFEG